MQPTPPQSAPACWWQLWVLGVAVRHIICGCYLFIFPSSYVALWDTQTPHRLAIECFPVFGNFSFKTPFLGWISIPTSFVSLFMFYILFYLLLKTMGCLSGCLMSSASIQRLFCGIFSAFKCSFAEFVGEKVVSLSCSSAILGPPPTLIFKNLLSLPF